MVDQYIHYHAPAQQDDNGNADLGLADLLPEPEVSRVADLQAPQEAAGLTILQYRRSRIACDLLRQTVNATNITLTGHVNSTALSRFFSQNPAMWKEVRRGGEAGTRGTYIALGDMQLLQQRFPTIPREVFEAVRDACAAHGYNGGP